MFITEYPTAHFDRDDGTVGDGCGAFNLDLPERITGIPSVGLPRISESDAQQIKRLGMKLNEAVKEAAEKHGWTYVDGIAEEFEGHGYCSNERYFVTVSESYGNQRDIQGTMHPNQKGQRVYADRIAATFNVRSAIDGTGTGPFVIIEDKTMSEPTIRLGGATTTRTRVTGISQHEATVDRDGVVGVAQTPGVDPVPFPTNGGSVDDRSSTTIIDTLRASETPCRTR